MNSVETSWGEVALRNDPADIRWGTVFKCSSHVTRAVSITRRRKEGSVLVGCFCLEIRRKKRRRIWIPSDGGETIYYY